LKLSSWYLIIPDVSLRKNQFGAEFECCVVFVEDEECGLFICWVLGDNVCINLVNIYFSLAKKKEEED